MCGIAGIINKRRDIGISDDIKKMLSTIIHRGPDGEGIEVYSERIGFGHRRLSIIDISENGRQPMCYSQADKTCWITFNGEIYNYLELKKELELKGYSFRTKTDTEVLIASYIHWGEDCVHHLNGMWSFAIYDMEKSIVFCSRDRFGVKPFYYMMDGDRFLFGSEIKELLEVFGGDVYANRKALEAFIASGMMDYSEQTMFKGVFQLMGGNNLTYDMESNKYKVEKWYDLNATKRSRHNFSDNARRFKQLFMKSVKFRLRSDVPVGSCLSGGLDSSSIVCAVHEILKGSSAEKDQLAVSSCFEDKRFDEQEYIDAVVDYTGIKSYKVFPDMNRLYDELDDLIWHMDEPTGTTSPYAQWNVFREAKRQGLKVMLDGQGADEQLAGYTAFYQLLFSYLLRHGKFKRFLHEVKCYAKLRASTENLSVAHVVASSFGYAYLPREVFSILKRINRERHKDYRFGINTSENKDILENVDGYDLKNPQKYIDASLHRGLATLLHCEDRNSMAFSIESRVPFLEYNLVEFVFSVPLDQKIIDGRTKSILREGMKDILPSKIYNRYSKLGFATPESAWIKKNKEMIRRDLKKSCEELSDIVDVNKTIEWFDAIIDSPTMGTFDGWRIICAARWKRIFDVKIGA